MSGVVSRRSSEEMTPGSRSRFPKLRENQVKRPNWSLPHEIEAIAVKLAENVSNYRLRSQTLDMLLVRAIRPNHVRADGIAMHIN